jgi:hypothetical protein
VPFFVVRRRHHLVDSRDEDVALRVDEFAHECDEIGHRFMNHAAEDT